MGTEQPGIARRVAVVLLAVVAASLATVALGTAPAGADDAPAVNESFESGTGLPTGWRFAEYTAGASKATVATGAGSDGSHFLQITSSKPNHARVVIPVPVHANTTYKFRAMAKATGADPKAAAAVLGVEGTYSVTDSVRTDKDWQPLELLFKTGSRTSVELALSLGYFGSANVGTASFDAATVSTLAAAPADKPIADLGVGAPTNAQQPASAADTAGSGSQGPSGALWVVLTILVIGGIAVAVFLARRGEKDSGSAGRDEAEAAEHDDGESAEHDEAESAEHDDAEQDDAERDRNHRETVGTETSPSAEQPSLAKDVTVGADAGSKADHGE